MVHQHKDIVPRHNTLAINFDKVLGEEQVFEKKPHVLLLLYELGVDLALSPVYLVMLHLHHVLAGDLGKRERQLIEV
jgi:hypothetical protein